MSAKKSYILEPVINSELILRNNSKKLLVDPSLYNNDHIDEIEELRNEYKILDSDSSKGLQKQKRDIRNRIRDLSTITFVDRDQDIFGAMITQIMDNLLTRPNFSGYSYKNDMKSLATEHIVKYTTKFDSYRQSEITGQYASAFTYITTIAFNAYVACINKNNKELLKAKEDFIETQKLIHRDANKSTIGNDYSEIEKTVKLNHIDTTLLEHIKMIPLDVSDILVQYPHKYKITIEEYKQITEYTKDKDVCMSLLREELSVELPVTSEPNTNV